MSSALRFKLDELLTVNDLAAKLKVSLKTVRSWIYFRKISFTKIGRRVYFSAGVVEELLNRNAVPSLKGGSSPNLKPTGQGGAQDQRGANK